MSNQNAGADRQSCAWCSVRIAVYFAAVFELPEECRWDVRIRLIAWRSLARGLQRVLATQAGVAEVEGCRGCLDSAAMHRGEDLSSHSQKQIVAANPVMARFVRIRQKAGE